MKVSIDWLKELVKLKVSVPELVQAINMKTIGTKEVTDEFIELDMKGYNRADLLSLRGIALEAAAITNSEVKFKEETADEYLWVEKKLASTPVKIMESDLAQIQCVAKIEGLKVKDSPVSWIKKIKSSGMRTVSNIADVTNLVMLEYGQPLHAFDASTVKDDTINVRRAKKGEKLYTLDGKLRQLTTSDIVLADTEKALDVAGVMGGKDTEIKSSTSTILLSASLFNPEMVRKTANRLKLQSEASKRFYHGLTAKRLLQALNAAIKMYQDLGGKLTALTLVGEFEDKLTKIPLELEKTNSLIGIELKNTQVEEYLKKLNFVSHRVTDYSWVVTPPYYRLDCKIEEDLIEEVARMYGYDQIPSKSLKGINPEPTDQSIFKLIHNLRHELIKLGLTEVQTYSFYSTKVLDSLGFNEENKKYLIKVANPMSVETEYLRMDIWPNLLEATVNNLKNFDDVAIFEIAKIYRKTKDIPQEKYVLSIALSNKSDNPVEELYAISKKAFEELKLEVSVEHFKAPAEAKRLFHPERLRAIKFKGKQIGGLAEVHQRVVNKAGSEKRIAILEIELEELKSAT